MSIGILSATINVTPSSDALHGTAAQIAAPISFTSNSFAALPGEATMAENIAIQISAFSLNTTQYPDYFAIISVA